MQFNPVINTSVRGHGKWGDFLIVLIPLSWCCNILINSNFILRMIEWQNESSLFTLRVQGKQWYWVYKFDATAAYNILTAPKNIGHNRWFFTTPAESYCADSYYQAIHLGAQLEYKELYLKFLKEEKKSKPVLANLSGMAVPLNFESIENPNSKNFNNCANCVLPEILVEEIVAQALISDDTSFVADTPVDSKSFYDSSKLDETADVMSNILENSKRKPLRIVRGVMNQHNLNTILSSEEPISKPIVFVAKFNNNTGSLALKSEDGEPLWGFKQKRYKRLQKFVFGQPIAYDPVTLEPISRPQATSPFTLKSTLRTFLNTEDFNHESFDYQNSIKYNRQRSELVPLNLARRLLRTKRTLVLPAHVNITVITNSYDVVHSWFIPGLGLKLDCVPGRSTHHTFYIDNIGFYYGQCAEICGRYHHHMPIRLCALPFEQFLVWWQKKGLKRLHRISMITHDITNRQSLSADSLKFRYRW